MVVRRATIEDWQEDAEEAAAVAVGEAGSEDVGMGEDGGAPDKCRFDFVQQQRWTGEWE